MAEVIDLVAERRRREPRATIDVFSFEDGVLIDLDEELLQPGGPGRVLVDMEPEAALRFAQNLIDTVKEMNR